MTAEEIQRLDSLAREATPGERKFEPHPYGYGYSVLWVPETRTEILVTGGRNDGDDPITWMGEELSDADREFIEVANPAAVLALIARVREAETALARYRAEDSDTERRMAAMVCDHGRALRDAEEAGYAKGLEAGVTHLIEIEADGLRAGRSDRPVSDCPYDEGTPRALAWLSGWAKS